MTLTPPSAKSRQILTTPLDQVRGVGPRIAEKLAKMGLSDVESALYTLPNRYEDRRQFSKIAHIRENRLEVFTGEILAVGESVTARGKKLYEVLVGDGSGHISLKWFHYRQSLMQKKFSIGRWGVFIGEVRRFGSIREIHHPDVEFLEGKFSPGDLPSLDPLTYGCILPVYPLTEGLHQKNARKIWREIVDRYAHSVQTLLPEEVLVRHNLLPLGQALAESHWPARDASLKELEEGRDAARRTLVFDEFFFLELGLALKRQGEIFQEGFAFQVSHRYTRPLAKMLPYSLTEAQKRVLGEIKRDMMAPRPMNRLLQGDVGSGKTVVALMASLIAIENNTQVAVVAPTEILAEQHFLQFHSWLEKLGLSVVLLSGSTPAAEKRSLLARIAAGKVHLVVGTHAVLQEGVEFQNLGLGVIDEQHRFGVRQRGVLRKKGCHPDILVMTATPIPRSLALTVYGDLSLSVIDQLPPGRKPVKTRIVAHNNRQQAYEVIRREITGGRQAYIVYPLVEESEKSDLLAATEGAEQLRQAVFPGVTVGLLHGRMKAEEKEAVMRDFKEKRIQILVSTTVIEVGIDVPNATVMMVEHAERFGLAQLHQLRGRVGRGSAEGACLLIRSERCSEDGRRRLEVMAETNDGFRIAEADLEIRGPGEFLGTRQSGIPDFRVANLLRDGRILEEARQEAFRLVEQPDFLTNPQYEDLRQELKARWGSRLELASLG
ncbi:MAG: ATP-dependent DNA helicase RecG [Syntrophotaleaceae bacterium]